MMKRKLLHLLSLLISSLAILKMQAQAPTITSFSPDSGSVGTLITVIGTNLGNITGFMVGGVSAIVVSDTAVLLSNYGDTLVGLVMPGSVTEKVSVTTAGGTAVSGIDFTVRTTPFPSVQQGNKLVGTGVVGGSQQGYSVSISADGNTAIVGGAYDNNDTGAVWFYTRSGGVWSQQGNELASTGFIYGNYGEYQGWSVSISADGNTAIVGGIGDDNYTGAAVIYTRSGGLWSQQGSKLVGTGAVGQSYQGSSVSISADGNTAIVGGWNDNNHTGATWVYTRLSGSYMVMLAQRP